MSSDAKPEKASAIDEAQSLNDVVEQSVEVVPMYPEHVDDVEVNEAIPQFGYFGYSLRELGIFVAALILVIAAFVTPGNNPFADFGFTWVLMSGGAFAAAVLIALRRLVPNTVDRVGSLSIDQFASVTFSVAALYWVGLFVLSFRFASGPAFAIWLGILGALGGVTLTVAAPHIPVLREDFVGRADALAHTIAAPARPILAVPRPVVAPDDVTAADDDVETVEDEPAVDDAAVAAAEEAVPTDDAFLEHREDDLDDMPPAPLTKD